MRKGLLFVLALALAARAPSQTVSDHTRATLVGAFDTTATPGFDYCAYSFASGGIFDPLGLGRPVAIRVTTSGSSTTVAAVTASSAPFAQAVVGDLIQFNVGGPPTQGQPGVVERVITAKASNDSVTVDQAITLDGDTVGYTFRLKKRLCGTAAGSGAFPVAGWSYITIVGRVVTINATSLDAQLECRAFGANNTAWVTVATVNFTAVGAKDTAMEKPYDECRVGWRVNTDTGAQSVYAYVVLRK